MRVLRRALPCELHRADGPEGHRQALPLEVGHDQREALVQLSEQVLLGHEHILEADRRGIGGVPAELLELRGADAVPSIEDRKSTRLNSSHSQISYAVFCLKKKKITNKVINQV